jgi:hypothetical protein
VIAKIRMKPRIKKGEKMLIYYLKKEELFICF